jgi:hypothetical protein
LPKCVAAQGERRQRGQQLVWGAQELAILRQIASTFDHIPELSGLYENARAVKTKLKLSQEIRLQRQQAVRLLKEIKTDLPAAPSMRTVKARRAARARWDRSPNASG